MTSKRLLCLKCALPKANCICHLACEIDNAIELLALQHPLEQHQSKNSLRILALCAKHIQVEIGEQFVEDELQSWLYANDKTPVLLYPPTEDDSIGLFSPAPLADVQLLTNERVRLVLLDATWKKSRKMLYLNPVLQKLPRLTLVDPPPSIYKIRKSHSQNQLSSLEACCYAWRQLEKNPSAYPQLLDAFAGFIDQQQLLIKKNID